MSYSAHQGISQREDEEDDEQGRCHKVKAITFVDVDQPPRDVGQIHVPAQDGQQYEHHSDYD